MSIGDLAVRVGADTLDLERGFDRAANRVKRFSSQASSNLKKATSVATKFSAVATGASLAIGLLQKESSTAAREVLILSKAANASTTEFQRMAFGAREFNIEQDKLADILKDVNDRIGDFVQTGGGPMADFFENIAPKIGVTIDQFRNLSGPQALQLYVSSLEKANISNQDMIFYMEAMASDATNLIPLLRNNGEEYGRLSKKADEFNAVISEQRLSKLAGAGKEFREIGVAITSARNATAELFIPELKKVKEFAVEISSRFVDIVSKLSEAKEQSKKLSEAESKIDQIIGKRSRRQIRLNQYKDQESKSAAKINELMLRQEEIEEILEQGYQRRTGNAARGNADAKKAFEAKKVALKQEMEANEILIQQLASQSAKAAEIKSIREGIAQAAAKEAETVDVKDVAKTVSTPKTLDANTQSDIDALKKTYLTKEELEREHRENMALIGEEFDALKFESEEQWRSIKEQAEKDHLNRLKEMNTKTMTDIQKFNAMSFRAQVKTVSGALTEMTQGVAQHNKQMFKINKAAGIATAIVNTAQAVTKALAAYPPPISFAMAAAQAAAGFAQISAIRSAKFGGGGGQAPSVTGSPAAGAAAPRQASSTSQQDAGRLTVENVNVGSLYDGETVRMLAERLAEHQKNGGTVVFA